MTFVAIGALRVNTINYVLFQACVIRSAAQSKRSGAPCHTCCENDYCNANCTSVPMIGPGIIIGEFMASVTYILCMLPTYP